MTKPKPKLDRHIVTANVAATCDTCGARTCKTEVLEHKCHVVEGQKFYCGSCCPVCKGGGR